MEQASACVSNFRARRGGHLILRGWDLLKLTRTACATLLAFLLWPVAANAIPMLYSRGGDTAARLFAAHNGERARVKVPLL